jgi:hypothetical protein
MTRMPNSSTASRKDAGLRHSNLIPNSITACRLLATNRWHARTSAIAGLALTILVACSEKHATLGPLVPLQSPDLPSLSVSGVSGLGRRQISQTEDSLIALLVAAFPGKRGFDLRRDLMDQKIDSISMPAHPEAQAILRQIAEIRTKRKDSEPAPALIAQRLLQVELVLLDEWSDTLSVATAIRGPGERNVILVPASATAANVAVGVRAMTALYHRAAGEHGTATRISARNMSVPARWKANGMDQYAEALLQVARGQPRSQLPGVVGSVRRSTIPVAIVAAP